MGSISPHDELSPEEIKHFNYKCDQLSGVEEWKPGCWKDGKWTCGTRDNDNNSVEGNENLKSNITALKNTEAFKELEQYVAEFSGA